MHSHDAASLYNYYTSLIFFITCLCYIFSLFVFTLNTIQLKPYTLVTWDLRTLGIYTQRYIILSSSVITTVKLKLITC